MVTSANRHSKLSKRLDMPKKARSDWGSNERVTASRQRSTCRLHSSSSGTGTHQTLDRCRLRVRVDVIRVVRVKGHVHPKLDHKMGLFGPFSVEVHKPRELCAPPEVC